ncbi:glycerol-3-phosphate acyltransferase RAM2-like [Typha angustifolia]|uniref:glycerol-3-phosphate acyltransferase RAM2-like n=1 Tax=Typha angustifolia TaxID=59011 RepID=UPI003C2E9DF3
MAEVEGLLFSQSVEECPIERRESHSVVADLEGTLLRSCSSFPYYALVAYDAGGPLRLLLLLLAVPLAGILYYVSESASIKVLIFATFSCMKVRDIESAARAVLPKYYSEDVHSGAWRVFSACGRRCVITASPRIMVEPFLKTTLRVKHFEGTEISTWGSRATGLVRSPGVVVGVNKVAAVRKLFPEETPNIGFGDQKTDYPFMRLCQERYLIPATEVAAVPLSKVPPNEVNDLPKDQIPRVMFHDGRLVQKPTPLLALFTLLWIPVGVLLAVFRIAIGFLLPMRFVSTALSLLGVRVIVHDAPPPPRHNVPGVLFACSHRTLLDPVFISIALRRPIPAVTYSISDLSKFLSPIPTVRLHRDRSGDAATIRSQLENGDLVICPEGTTCREPFLLRFSALFAELTNRVIPVAVEARMGMFYGTTVRGWKGLDSFHFFMNPSPAYKITFLPEQQRVSDEILATFSDNEQRRTAQIGRANSIQRLIGENLSYLCTTCTRPMKYAILKSGN